MSQPRICRCCGNAIDRSRKGRWDNPNTCHECNYPDNWPDIAADTKAKHGWCCERCGHANDTPSGHVLTVHHLDGNPSNCEDWNLAALCQRCHLRIQGRVKMDQLFMDEILGTAAWFKPHLEGYLRSKNFPATVEENKNNGPVGTAGAPKTEMTELFRNKIKRQHNDHTTPLSGKQPTQESPPLRPGQASGASTQSDSESSAVRKQVPGRASGE